MGEPSISSNLPRRFQGAEGYKTPLIVLYGAGLLVILFANFVQSFIYSEIAIIIGSDILVYFDAKKVNELRGAKVINATNWLLYCLLLWIVALPWYVFRTLAKAFRGDSVRR
jgi:hypothetical protein